MTKTIFLTSNNYRPHNGGVVQSLEVLQQELLKNGYNAFIITLAFTQENHDSKWIIRLKCPIRFKYKSNYMAIPFWTTMQLEKLVNQYKPAILHVHHPFLLGSSALNVARKKKIPIIFTYHTQYEAYSHYIPGPQQIIKKIITNKVKKFCSAVDGIIAPTESMKAIIEHYTKKPIAVIPSAIRSEFFAKEPKHNTQKPINLLYVGRFVKEKNIQFLLSAVKDLSVPFVFRLVGFGNEIRALQNYAYHELKLSSRQVIFIAQPSFEELIKYYRTADLFLFSSTTDTQALVLAEAMASGLPVIAIEAIGARDIVNNGNNGFLIHSETEMKNCIELIHKNPEMYQELSKRALETAQNYRSSHFGQSIISLYQKMAL